MTAINNLTIKIFADGANKSDMLTLYENPYIKGFTTNPTLMHKAGITDYQRFARDILKEITDKPISFEVFSDDFKEMKYQALKISEWGNNVYVKIPVSNTQGKPSYDLIHELAQAHVKQNVTALMTLKQTRYVSEALGNIVPACISIFAGRIADTGRDPLPPMAEAVILLKKYPAQELIWASPRELLNIFQAEKIGCHIITVTKDILSKLKLVNKSLDEYSLETVKMFYDDAVKANFMLELSTHDNLINV